MSIQFPDTQILFLAWMILTSPFGLVVGVFSSVLCPESVREERSRPTAEPNAYLREADINGARPLLEHAIEHGSARAALMLVESYDTRAAIAAGTRNLRQSYEGAPAL